MILLLNHLGLLFALSGDHSFMDWLIMDDMGSSIPETEWELNRVLAAARAEEVVKAGSEIARAIEAARAREASRRAELEERRKVARMIDAALAREAARRRRESERERVAASAGDLFSAVFKAATAQQRVGVHVSMLWVLVAVSGFELTVGVARLWCSSHPP